MKDFIKCPKCGSDAKCFGRVSCLCDKDFCLGQRCGADKLFSNYTCEKCGYSGTPPETQNYYDKYMMN